MAPTFALTAPEPAPELAPARPKGTTLLPRSAWAGGIVERLKAWIANIIGLPAMLPGQDGWYL
jgi:hypothetical protein